LVLDNIGTKLQEFSSSHKVVKVVYAAFLGKLAKHWQSVMHPDLYYSPPGCLQGWYPAS